jgi:hypothetical protein
MPAVGRARGIDKVAGAVSDPAKTNDKATLSFVFINHNLGRFERI